MKHALYTLFGFFLLFLDLHTKYLAQEKLTKAPFEIIPEIFIFEFHTNPGIAFSLPVPNIVQIILTIVLLGFLVWYWKKEKRTNWENFSFVAIIAGAIGNFFERICCKEVTDFIAILHFPVFNIADMCISLGVTSLIVFELFIAKNEKKDSETETLCTKSA